MAKWYRENQMIGERGETLAQLAALEMGFLYNRVGMDAGIDGEIEIRDPITQEVTGQIVRVQSKATDNPFPKETDEGFEYPCDQRDLDYWLSSNVPVLLVCSRPKTREVYWVCLQDYFDTPEKRTTKRVRFNKATDRFDESAKDRIIGLARDKKAGLYINPAPNSETLYSNLLPVDRLPKHIYSAETQYAHAGLLIGKAREMDIRLRRGWSIWNGRVWSVFDLSTAPWDKLCDVGTVETYDGEEWATSTDRDRQNLFSWLLRGCLDDMLWKKKVRYDRPMDHYHVMAPYGLSTKQIEYVTHKGNKSKVTVFNSYSWASKTGADRSYYRHYAFEGRFEFLGGRWYLRINPTYRYTSDGKEVDRFYETHLSGMKKREKNRSVLSQVEVWAHLISHGSHDDGMFSEETPIGFGRLLELNMPVGINDALWIAKDGGDGETIEGVVTLFESNHRED